MNNPAEDRSVFVPENNFGDAAVEAHSIHEKAECESFSSIYRLELISVQWHR